MIRTSTCVWRVALSLLFLAMLASCAQVGYYAQAIHGQMSVLHAARPIDDWLNDPDTPDRLRHKLERVRGMRNFASQELALPDNRSYRNYAELDRPFVLWNVVAAPELSLKARHWCFPVAGCVEYRGYYSYDDALAYAKELRAQGYDVQVSGVPAYSTLGWFNDPVLSTFINYPDAEVARLLFHELGHQVAYAPGDTPFNESFATAVEEIGVERWLTTEGSPGMRDDYRVHESRKQDFLALLLKARQQLQQVYDSDVSDAEKRHAKQMVFADLQRDYQQLKQMRWHGYSGYDRWFAQPLGNAHLALVAAYNDFVPAFRILRDRAASLTEFYAQVRELANMSTEPRHQRLASLNSEAQDRVGSMHPLAGE